MHIHHSDDEAWYVLEGSLRFKLADGEVDAPAGTTVFVPAGTPHTYRVMEPSRYLIFLTPKLDRLIARLHRLQDRSALEATLAGSIPSSVRSAFYRGSTRVSRESS